MFARYSVLNLPPLPPPPTPSMGCGGGDKKCRKSKESPPWVCEKCAKKTAEERRRGMGCPDHETASVEAEGETSEATLDLGRDGHSVGCMSRPPGAPDETSEGILDLGRHGHSVGCGYEAPEDVNETSEATLDLGCDKCQKGKKRRQAAARNNMNLFPTGRLNLQGGPMLRQVPLMGSGGGHGGRSVPYSRNYQEDEMYEEMGRNGMLGQVPIVGLGNGGRGGRAFTYKDHGDWPYRYCDPAMEDCPLPLVGPVLYGSEKKRCTGVHRVMGQAASYGCPVGPPDTSDPTLNCQRDARGNAVCSNGLHYPPGCPHTPPEQFFSPGIAPDEVHNGILEARIPPPRQAGSAGASGVPGAPGASSTPTNILPLAAGGIAVVGLLYAILR